MYAQFREVYKAVNYLAEGLQGDFPDGQAEVIQFSKTHTRTRITDVAHIVPILENATKRFPHAAVSYNPEHPYGLVGEIVCRKHCNDPVGRSGKKKRWRSNFEDDAPRVVVILTHSNQREILVGAEIIPARNPGLLSDRLETAEEAP